MATQTATTRPHERNQGAVRQTVDSAVSSTHDLVENRPLSSMAVVFGAGFGLGILIGCALADNAYTSRTNNRSIEAFGNKILERVANLVPDAVSQQFHR